MRTIHSLCRFLSAGGEHVEADPVKNPLLDHLCNMNPTNVVYKYKKPSPFKMDRTNYKTSVSHFTQLALLDALYNPDGTVGFVAHGLYRNGLQIFDLPAYIFIFCMVDEAFGKERGSVSGYLEGHSQYDFR